MGKSHLRIDGDEILPLAYVRPEPKLLTKYSVPN